MPFSISILCSRTDEEAMWRVKMHDDHRAFARLVERWEAPILRLCARMTGDVHRAQDLKQETFSRVFEKRREYEPQGRFSTWLWRIALNACYDELRRRKRRPDLLPDPEAHSLELLEQYADDAPSPDLHTAQLDEGELVRQALLQLPEIYRSVIILRHYENLKLTKIAEILGIPEGTVNSRMAEALTRLSRLLEPKLRIHSGARPPAPGAAGETPSPNKRVTSGGTPAPIPPLQVFSYEPSKP